MTFIVADVDRKDSRDGYADFQRLFGLHPRDAATPMATSPSGGMHVFYRARKAYKNIAAIDGSGIDARSRGGYVLLPTPGNGREWLRPYIGVTSMLDAPEWFDRHKSASRPEQRRQRLPLSTDSEVLDRGRFALEQACHAIENAPNGAQETTLNKEAYTVGGMVARGDIPWAEAREELIAAAKRMPAYGKPWRKLDKKIERALEDGMARPLSPRDNGMDPDFTVIDDNSDGQSNGCGQSGTSRGGEGVGLADFVALMQSSNYIFMPSGDFWPASRVDARIPPVPPAAAGKKAVKASVWLARNAPVEQMTWARECRRSSATGWSATAAGSSERT